MFKKSKLISSLIPLAVLSIFASITGVKAESTNNVYEVTGAYKVEIPAEVSVNPTTKNADITVNAELASYNELDISVKSQNSFQLKCGDSYELSYTLTDSSENEISQIVYSTQDGTKKTFSTELNAKLADNAVAKVCGNYSDILTFTMDCKESYPEGKVGLTFDANGGTVDTEKCVLEIGAKCENLPTPSKLGYKFAGWYTEISDGKQVTANDKITQNTTVYAHWTANTYTVKYDNNQSLHSQSSGSMDDSEMIYDKIQTLKACIFENGDKGAKFTGWNTKPDGTGTKYGVQAEVSNLTTVNGATITLYAQWEYENKVIVCFEDVNGNFQEEDTRKVVSGIYPSGQTISWHVSDLDEYKKNSKPWEKQWQTPNVEDANYTTTNASKTTTIKIKRQMYYLDLNAQWYKMVADEKEPVKGGEGNLKWNGTETVAAKAEVIVNGESKGSGLTDYFKQHRYGSTFEFIITMESGYELLGIADTSAQPLSKVAYDKNEKKVTGIVTGEREANSSNSDTGKYFVTSVALCIMQKSTENTTPDTEGKSLDEEAENSDSQNTEFVSNEENTSVDIDTTDSAIPCDTDLEWENSNTEDALAQDENSDNQILSETGQTVENLDIQEIEPDQMQAESESENEADESFSE